MANQTFLRLCAAWKLPAPVVEHKFCEGRHWRMDYAWPAYSIGLEVDGGLFSGGRHARGAGILKEHEKMNAAACMGFRIIRRTPQNLLTKETEDILRQVLT